MKTTADLISLATEIAKRIDSDYHYSTQEFAPQSDCFSFEEDGWEIDIEYDCEYKYTTGEELRYTINRVDACYFDETAYLNDSADDERYFSKEETEAFMRALENELKKLNK